MVEVPKVDNQIRRVTEVGHCALFERGPHGKLLGRLARNEVFWICMIENYTPNDLKHHEIIVLTGEFAGQSLSMSFELIVHRTELIQ